MPACVVALVVLLYLTDRPHEAPGSSRRSATGSRTGSRLSGSKRSRRTGISACGEAISDPRVLMLALVYFCLNGGSYGVSYFLPTIVKGFGLTTS